MGVHTLISGAHRMLQNRGHTHDAAIAEVLVSTPAQSIAGGTDQISRTKSCSGLSGLLCINDERIKARRLARQQNQLAGMQDR